MSSATTNGAPAMRYRTGAERIAAQAQDIHRTLPHSVEAEQGVLSSMMIGGREVMEECKSKIGVDWFYVPAHQTIFNLLLMAHESGVPTDLVTFTQAVRDYDPSCLDAIGGAVAITQLFTFVPTAANVTYYLEIVREKWILRQIIARCVETCRRAYEEQDEVDALLDEFISKTIEIGQLTDWANDRLQHISAFVTPAVEEIKATYYNRGAPVGLTSGFVDLDRMTGGFQAPLPYYIAARPAMGKSSVMIEIGEHIAIANAEKGINVGIFSVEMTGRQLAKRILCSRANINLQRLRDGFLSKETIPQLEQQAEIVEAGNLYIDEQSLSINQFRALARRAVLKFKCRILLIDYIQRMHSTSKRAQGNRELEMNEIAQGISATAKELNVPIIVLAQLNRQNEQRPDKTPQLSDLRESGSMEQEARCVFLLHRPVYYCLTEGQKKTAAKKLKLFQYRANLSDGEPEIIRDEYDEPLVDLEEFEQYAQLIVAKQNDGPVGEIRLRFVKEYARYESVTTKLFSNKQEERQQIPMGSQSE